MTHDARPGGRRPAPGWRAGSASPCCRRLVRPLRRAGPRRCSTPAGARARSCWSASGSPRWSCCRSGSSRCAAAGTLLRRNAGLILVYGAVAVAGAQFCYFSAVQHMQVGPALLIEYTAPAAVVVWMWLRHGQRPGPVTLVGAGLAALGLVLVLDLLSGADLSLAGVLWALAAMVGAATYFVISADEDNGLPPMALAAGGLVVGGARARPARAGRAAADARLHGERRRTPARTSTGGSRCCVLGVVTAALALHHRHRRRAAASAPGWRRSWRCSRWSPAWSSPGCCSTSCRGRSSCSAAC